MAFVDVALRCRRCAGARRLPDRRVGGDDGPGAGIYAPVVEAMRIVHRPRQRRGGVNGKPVKLIVLDDGAEPSRAAANAKKLTQDNVLMLVNSSLSSTYAPMVAESKRANIPLLFAGSVCPKETYPPADPLQFCSSAFGANLDSQGGARLRQGAGQGAGADRLRGDGDPDLARRDRLRRGPVEDDGHDAGRKADLAAARARLHAVRHQAEGREPELGLFVGAVGGAGAHVRGDAPAGLERPLHHLGAPQRRGGARAHQGRRVLRDRHQRALPGRSAGARRDPRVDAPRQADYPDHLSDRRLHRRPGDRVAR